MSDKMGNGFVSNNEKSTKANFYGGEKKKNRVFAPVTLKMIRDAAVSEEGGIEIGGEPVSEITIIGRILYRHEESMRHIFEINDSTGTHKVTFYQSNENQVSSALKNFEYVQGSYVKIFGTVRIFKEDKAIVGTHIKKIEKHDEITNHLLQVFVSAQMKQKGVLSLEQLKPTQAEKPKQTKEDL